VASPTKDIRMKLKTLLLCSFIAMALGAMVGYAAVSGYQHGKAAALVDRK
jgi:hypothetical protein